VNADDRKMKLKLHCIRRVTYQGVRSTTMIAGVYYHVTVKKFGDGPSSCTVVEQR
jgi:hypothetical protein